MRGLGVLLALVVAGSVQLILVQYATPRDVHYTGRSLRDGRGWFAQAEDVVREAVARVTGVRQPSPSPATASRAGRTAQDQSAFFAGSKLPRTDRASVQFRVGQVVRHKLWGYRGVIVGWDKLPQAPDSWFESMGVKPAQRHSPFYSVLVDIGDRGPPPQTTYVFEGNLKADSGTIDHPETSHYLKEYMPAMGVYRLKDWLRLRYPKD